VRHIVVLSLLLLNPLSAAARNAVPARLTAEDRAAVERIESYLNDIRTVAAPFMQTAADGGQVRGMLHLSRPGRIRFDYDPPVPIEVIGTGRNLVYHDKELKQVSYIPLDSTPLGILLGERIRLAGELTITRLDRQAGVIRLTLEKSRDADSGRITLVFADRPLELRQWTLVDAQGVETRVALLNPIFDVAVDPKLFDFDNPYFGRSAAPNR
jgi:outer membrane lipoprotein-sorting protein